MANLDQLNFEVKINDSEFNQKCNAMMAKAQELNTSLSRLLDLTARISSYSKADEANARRANRIHASNVAAREKENREVAKTVAKQKELNALADARIAMANVKVREMETRETEKTVAAQRRLNATMSRQGALLSQLKTIALSYFGVMGTARIIGSMVRVSAEFEMQRRTLQYIIQDSYKGLKIFEQIKDLAVMSPFTFKELMTYTKQLSAFSVPKGELFETTKMLADVSAGLGVSMDRLILAYGQIRSASFLRGQEVRQLTEAGVPILEDLRRQFVEMGEEGITVGDVFDKISKRLVPFEMVAKVFKDMTSEGGKFYKMQEVQAETLQGKISNLKDAYQIMFAEIGGKGESILKGSVDFLTKIAKHWEDIGHTVVELTIAFGTYHATLALFKAIAYVKEVGSIIKAIKSLTAVQKILNAVMATNPYAIIAATVAGLTAHFIQASESAKAFSREISKMAFERLDEGTKKVERFDKLSDALRNAAKGSQDYRDAISKLNREYGEYLPNLLTETNALEELARAQDTVTQSIKNRAKAEAEDLAKDKVENIYGEARDYYAQAALRKLTERGVAAETAQEVWREFTNALKQKVESGETDYKFLDLFNEAYKSVEGEDYISGWERFWNGVKQNTLFIRNEFEGNQTGWETLLTSIENYGKAVVRANEKMEDSKRLINATFGANYSLREQEEVIANINKLWDEEKDKIKNAELSLSEYEKRSNRIELNRQAQLKDAYLMFGRSDLANEAQKEIDKLLSSVVGYGEIVNDVLKEMYGVERRGAGLGQYFVTTDTKRDEYFKMLRDNFGDVSKAVVDAEAVYKSAQKQFEDGLISEAGLEKEKKNYETLKQEKEAIENIAKALGLVLEKEKKGSTRTVQNPRIAELKREADLLKDVMRLYDQYTDLGAVSDEQSLKILSNIYGDKFGVASGGLLDFDAILENIIAELNTLGEAGQKAAQAVSDSFTRLGKKDVGTDLLQSMRAYMNFQQKMKEMLDKNYGVEGDDIGYKLSKIALNVLNAKSEDATAYQKAQQDIEKLKPFIIARAQANGKENAEAEWEAYKDAALRQLDELYKAKNRADKKSAQESINDLGKQYVKDAYFKAFGKENPLSEWADKSIFTIGKIRNQLKGIFDTIKTDGLNITDDVKTQLEEAGLNTEELLKIVLQIVKVGKEEADQNFFEKIAKSAKEAASLVEGVFSSFAGLEETKGHFDVASTLQTIGKALSTTANVFEKLVNKDYTGAAAEVLAYAVEEYTRIEEEEEKAKKQLEELNRATDDFILKLRLAQDVDTIFGMDKIKSLKNAVSEMQRAGKAMDELFAKNEDLRTMVSKTGEASWLRRVFTGKEDRQWLSLADTIKKFWGLDANDPQQLLKGIENLLEGRIEQGVGSILSDNDVQYLKDMERAVKDFIAANEQVKQVISDIWGSVADDMTTKMVDAYLQMGDAAHDLAGNIKAIFADIAQSIAQSLIQNFVIEEVLNKFDDRVRSLMASMMVDTPENTAAMFTALTDDIINESQKAADFANRILSSLEEAGVMFNRAEEGDSLSNGIKGVTEDTANLLASYLNAIRADVSFNKVQVSGLSADMKVLLGLVPQTNTLEFYLEQIRAASVNTAGATASILRALQDVITSEGGEPSVRTLNS